MATVITKVMTCHKCSGTGAWTDVYGTKRGCGPCRTKGYQKIKTTEGGCAVVALWVSLGSLAPWASLGVWIYG